MTAVTSVAALGPRPMRTAIKTITTGAGVYGIFDVTMSAAYATGGDTLDFGASFGVIGGSTGTKQPTAVFVQPNAGYVGAYDLTHKQMKAYRQSAATSALTEPNGVDLHLVVFRCLVFW